MVLRRKRVRVRGADRDRRVIVDLQCNVCDY